MAARPGHVSARPDYSNLNPARNGGILRKPPFLSGAEVCSISRPWEKVSAMRVSIELDEDLLSAAMAATALPTRKATVEEGLRLLVRVHAQVEAIGDLKGLGWDGNLNAMRQGLRR
jgi:Arc/MetJ family transcription regulator